MNCLDELPLALASGQVLTNRQKALAKLTKTNLPYGFSLKLG
jgi:hypothetical protein